MKEGGEVMEISDLVAYAAEKYHIEEQHKWTDFPGFSVLSHPRTGKWVALLMRQWDMDTGTEIERCDLKCGKLALLGLEKPYLFSPIRMQGQNWIGVSFGDGTEPEVVFRLFDRAVAAGEQHGFTIVLDAQPSPVKSDYQDTAIPFSASAYRPEKEALPGKLRQMRRLFVYGRESMTDRAKSFYRQAQFMQDYEDDYPWSGDFVCYFPTYHDLNTRQLRGYFTWRTGVRRGDFRPIATSAAYLYVYELLNGIGASSPEDALEKLKSFEAGYLDSGIGDARMRQNLCRWMLEFAVIQNLPPETAQQYADEELLRSDASLAALRSPRSFPEEEVFSAICHFGGKKLLRSPVFMEGNDRGRHLIVEVWRSAASACIWQDKDLFTLCFGNRVKRKWYPLANAVYWQRSKPADTDYVLDPCRSYHCRSGFWQTEAYEKLSFDKDRFNGFLRETDLRLRRYFKTGRYLQEKPEDAWAAPYIDAVIEADRKAAIEAARPKIRIDLSGLEQIRKDALSTRDSLLTEEELAEIEDYEEGSSVTEDSAEDTLPDIQLDRLRIQILRALLRGESADELIRSSHLTASLAADGINEALYDEIGDTVLFCEDDRLLLVDDYIEDLERILGGTQA